MKYLLLILAFFAGSQLRAQDAADKIVGKWMKLPKEDLIIEVFEANGAYNGKIEWSSDTAKQKGFLILENLQFDENDSWENGKIYDPKSGNQYKAAARLKADGTLEVMGYKGFKMIGSKRSFKRVK